MATAPAPSPAAKGGAAPLVRTSPTASTTGSRRRTLRLKLTLAKPSYVSVTFLSAGGRKLGSRYLGLVKPGKGRLDVRLPKALAKRGRYVAVVTARSGTQGARLAVRFELKRR